MANTSFQASSAILQCPATGPRAQTSCTVRLRSLLDPRMHQSFIRTLSPSRTRVAILRKATQLCRITAAPSCLCALPAALLTAVQIACQWQVEHDRSDRKRLGKWSSRPAIARAAAAAYQPAHLCWWSGRAPCASHPPCCLLRFAAADAARLPAHASGAAVYARQQLRRQCGWCLCIPLYAAVR